MITIRVTDEEYETLRAATWAKGYRNVSELARAAMQTVTGEHLAPHQILAKRVDEHSSRIAALSRKLERLMNRPGSVEDGNESSEPVLAE